MYNLDDDDHCVPDISRHHILPLQTLAWQLHRLHRWQLVGVRGTRSGGLDHVEEEAWLQCPELLLYFSFSVVTLIRA